MNIEWRRPMTHFGGKDKAELSEPEKRLKSFPPKFPINFHQTIRKASSDSIHFNKLFSTPDSTQAIKVVRRQTFYTSCLRQFSPSTNSGCEIFIFALLAHCFSPILVLPFDAFIVSFTRSASEKFSDSKTCKVLASFQISAGINNWKSSPMWRK